jgi:hypothetical protein
MNGFDDTVQSKSSEPILWLYPPSIHGVFGHTFFGFNLNAGWSSGYPKLYPGNVNRLLTLPSGIGSRCTNTSNSVVV